MQEIEIALGHVVCSELGSKALAPADVDSLLWEFNRMLPLLCCSKASGQGAQRVLLPLPVQLSLLSHILLSCAVLKPRSSEQPCPVLALATMATQASFEASKQHNLTSSISGVESLMDTVAVPILCLWGESQVEAGSSSITAQQQRAALQREANLFVQDLWCNSKVRASPAIAARGALHVMSFLASLNRADGASGHAAIFARPDQYPSAFNRYQDVLAPQSAVIEVTGGAAAGETPAAGQPALTNVVPLPPKSAPYAAFQGLAVVVEQLTRTESAKSARELLVVHPFQLSMAAVVSSTSDGFQEQIAACIPELRTQLTQGAVEAAALLNGALLHESPRSFVEYAAGVDARLACGVQLALCAAPWLASAETLEALESVASLTSNGANKEEGGSKKRKKSKKAKAEAPTTPGVSPVQLAESMVRSKLSMLKGVQSCIVIAQCEAVLSILAQLHQAGAVREDKDHAPYPVFSILRYTLESVLAQLQTQQAHEALTRAVENVLKFGGSLMQHKLPSMLGLLASCSRAHPGAAAKTLAVALTSAGHDRQLPIVAFAALFALSMVAAGHSPAFAQDFAEATKAGGNVDAQPDALQLVRSPVVAAAQVDTAFNMPNGQVVPFASLLASVVSACATAAGVTGLHDSQNAFVAGSGPVLTAVGSDGDKASSVNSALGTLVVALGSGAPHAGKAPKTPKSAKKRRRESSPSELVSTSSQAVAALDAASCMLVAQVATIRVTRSNYPSVAALTNSLSQAVSHILSSNAANSALSCTVRMLVCVQDLVSALSAYIPELSPMSPAWGGDVSSCGWMCSLPATVLAGLGQLDGSPSSALQDTPFATLLQKLEAAPHSQHALQVVLQRALFAVTAFHATGDDAFKTVASEAARWCLRDAACRSHSEVSLVLSHLPALEWACGAAQIKQWCSSLHSNGSAQQPLLQLLGSSFVRESGARSPEVAAALFSACVSQLAYKAHARQKVAKSSGHSKTRGLSALLEPVSDMREISAAAGSHYPTGLEPMALHLAQALQHCAQWISETEQARAVVVCLSLCRADEGVLTVLEQTSSAIDCLAALSHSSPTWLLQAINGPLQASTAAIQLAAQALAGSPQELPSESDVAQGGDLQMLQLSAAAASAARNTDSSAASKIVLLLNILARVEVDAVVNRGPMLAAVQLAARLSAAMCHSQLLQAVCGVCTRHSQRISANTALHVLQAAVSKADTAFLRAAVSLWVQCADHAQAGSDSLLRSLEAADGPCLAWLVSAACSSLSGDLPSDNKQGSLLLLEACLQHPAAFDSAEVGQSAQVLVPQIPVLLQHSKLHSAAHAAVLLSAMTAITAAPSMVALTARDVTAVLIAAASLVGGATPVSDDLVLQVFTLLNQVAKHHKRVTTATLPVCCALLVRGLELTKQGDAGHQDALASMLYRCCVQLVRSARPAAVRHHAPQLVAAFVTAAARHRQAGAAAIPSTGSAEADKAVLEGMYRIFDTMSSSEFQHVFSAVADYPGARQVLKTARKQWTSEHRYTGQ